MGVLSARVGLSVVGATRGCISGTGGLRGGLSVVWWGWIVWRFSWSDSGMISGIGSKTDADTSTGMEDMVSVRSVPHRAG